MQPRFQVGDKAYYPVHGIAEVVGLEKREIGAKSTHVYILKIRKPDGVRATHPR